MATGRVWPGLIAALVVAQVPRSPDAWAAPGASASVAGAQAHYRRFEFHECLLALDEASAAAKQAAELATIEMYRGLCTLGLGRRADAVDHFRAAVRLDPSVRLPPLTAPKVQRFFESAIEAVQRAAGGPTAPPAAKPSATAAPPTAAPPTAAPLGAAPLAATPLVASPPSAGVAVAPAAVIDTVPPLRPPRRASRVVRVLPYVLGGLALVGAAASAYCGAMAVAYQGDAKSAVYESQAIAAGDRARDRALWANVTAGVAGALAVAALVAFLVRPPAEASPR